VSSIADRIRERERERLILRSRVRRAIRLHLPALLTDYVKMLFGTIVGFGIVTFLLHRYTDVDPLWVLGGVALLYSLRAVYYEVKLATDPAFTVPKCGCARAADDRTEVVLRSAYSRLLGVPNAAIGSALYIALLVAVQLEHDHAATALAFVAVAGSAYLGYAMVVRIGALCSTCVTIAGLNLLILWQLLV
jgi:uncharacterized membrane protein